MRIVHLTSAHFLGDTRIFHKQFAAAREEELDVVLVGTGPVPESSPNVISIGQVAGRYRRFAYARRAVVNKCIELGGDIAQLHDPELLPFAHRLEAAGFKVVYDMHEYVPGAILGKDWLPPMTRPVLSAVVEKYERRVLRHRPVIFAEDSYRAAYGWIGAPTVTVRNFPDLRLLRPLRRKPADRDPHLLVYSGGVSAPRGFDEMCEAVVILREVCGIPARLLCVGPYGAREEALASAANDRVGTLAVSLTGRLSFLESMQRLSRGAVGLAVLRRTRNYEQSYPTKMFEYMGLGLPFVVSDFEINRAVVEAHECGVAIQPGDPDLLARVLARILGNLDIAHDMGLRGQVAAERHYNWELEKAKLIAFYREVGCADGSSPSSAVKR